jgi:ketosteroid isomerase-like protein
MDTTRRDTVERSPAIEDLVKTWFHAATTGDASVVDLRVSSEPGVRLIGSDPDEWLSGGEEIRTFLRGEVEGAAGAVMFSPADIEAYEEGSVGWATARLTITMPDGRWVSPRWSAVWRREDDVWRFVQTHASVAVSNDQVGWTYPERQAN